MMYDPLKFVNWEKLNRWLRNFMWMVVIVLVIIIMIRLMPPSSPMPAHHAPLAMGH